VITLDASSIKADEDVLHRGQAGRIFGYRALNSYQGGVSPRAKE
jgi:hypothetical protein